MVVRCIVFLNGNAQGTRRKGRLPITISVIVLLALSTAFGLAQFAVIYVSCRALRTTRGLVLTTIFDWLLLYRVTHRSKLASLFVLALSLHDRSPLVTFLSIPSQCLTRHHPTPPEIRPVSFIQLPCSTSTFSHFSASPPSKAQTS